MRILIGVFIFGLAVFFGKAYFQRNFLLSPRHTDLSNITHVSAAASPAVNAQSNRSAPIVHSAPPVSEVSNITQSAKLFSQPPKDPVVHFEIKDGLAIAFGDVVLGRPMDSIAGSQGQTEVQRPHLWERGIVPFFISPDVVNPERIRTAIEVFHARTKVRFVELQNQSDALIFEKGKEHCYSYLGKVGGHQPLFLSPQCGTQEILHEMMHALGFVHEHSRFDRDQYVQINWQNITSDLHLQFAIAPREWMNGLDDFSFDAKSVMMYRSNAFAVDPAKPTITMKDDSTIAPIASGLSPSDSDRVNRLYP